jgi:hypothetical protein
MNLLRRPLSLCTVFIGLLAVAPVALAQTYDFAFTDLVHGVSATGMIDTTGGLATIGSITISGAALDGTFDLVQPQPTSVRGGDGTDIIFNNLVLSSGNPMLDSGGLGFAGGQRDISHFDYVVNLYGNGPGNYGLFEAGSLSDGTGHVYVGYDGGTLSLTAIPEPSTYAAILGLVSLGFAVVYRRKTVQLAS